jgi:uncharacterized protein (DUF58 family)
LAVAASFSHYWRHPVTVLLTVLVASILCGIVVQKQALLVGQGAGIILILGLLLPRVTAWGVSARGSFSRGRVIEGEFVSLQLTLRHCFWWTVHSLRMSVLRNVEDVRAVAAIPPRVETPQEFLVSFSRRGRVDSRDLLLWTNHPLGIARASKSVQVESPIVIWPKPASIPFRIEVGDWESAIGNTTRFGSGSIGDFSGLRSFREGDRLRRVHWAQTARRDQLIVCEMQSFVFPQATIVLDLDPRVHVGSGSNSSSEWSIRIAAGLVKSILENGGRVSVVLGDKCIRSHERHDGFASIMDALAFADSSRSHTLDDTIERMRGHGPSIIVTTDLALNHREQMIHHRWHWVVVQTGGFGGVCGSPTAVLPVEPDAIMVAPGVWEAMDAA